jgi:hypothetical protein
VFGLFGKKNIADQSLTWGDPQRVTSINGRRFLGCDITITCPARGMIILNCEFLDCTIRVRRQFVDYQFFNAGFERCRFIGSFPGCEFGYRASARPTGRMRGYVRDCDFSQAKLDLVGFNEADVATIGLPPWPHFLIKSRQAFADVVELRDDPEWILLAETFWPPERTGLVLRYESGGRTGINLPDNEARRVLGRYHNFIVSFET